jgi:hypothetical protein
MKVLIHIPKNAGTSIRKQFSPHKPVWEKHACLQEIFDALGDQQFLRHSYLGIVRNPYARIYSWYKFHKKHKVLAQFYHGSFSEWVLRGCPHHYSTSPYFGLRTGLKYDAYSFAPTKQNAFLKLHGKLGTSTMVETVESTMVETVESTMVESKIPEFVKIIKLEEMKERWAEIQLFFDVPANIAHENISATPKEYKRFYNNKSRGMVEKLCNEDLVAFDYAFE